MKTKIIKNDTMLRMLKILIDNGDNANGNTAGNLGFELWGTKAQRCKDENTQATMFCRPAGKLLKRAEELGLVRSCWEFKRKKTIWLVIQRNATEFIKNQGA